MSWSDRHYFAAAVLLYGVGALYAIFLFRRGFRKDNRVNYLLLLAGFGLHTVAMLERGFSLRRCPINNLYEACTFVAWTIVAAYLVLGLWRRLRFVGAFASPFLLVLGVFALMPGLDAQATDAPLGNVSTSFHASLILLSYGAFGISSVAGIMFLCQEHDLKFDRLRALFSLLPPMQRLDRIVAGSLLCGFVFLTLGLGVGAFVLQPPAGLTYWRDPKVQWSVLVWLLYLSLLALRWRSAQGGRRAAWGAVGGFAFVMLTFWGTNLLSNIHNP